MRIKSSIYESARNLYSGLQTFTTIVIVSEAGRQTGSGRRENGQEGEADEQWSA